MKKQVEISPDFIKSVRARLGLTQSDFSRLIGVCHMTISKWERGKLVPSVWQKSIIETIDIALKKKRSIKKDAAYIIESRGPIYALYLILDRAFKIGRWK